MAYKTTGGSSSGSWGGASNSGGGSSSGSWGSPVSSGNWSGNKAVKVSAAPSYSHSVAAPAPRPTYTPQSPSRPPAARQSTPATNYGSNASGNIVPAAPAPTVPAAPAPPSIEQWLANDTTYKSQHDALTKAISDYVLQSTASQNQYGVDYTTNTGKLAENRTNGGLGLQDDYASRGLMNSGLYAKAYGDLQTQYDSQQKDLDTAKANFITKATTDTGNFKTESGLKDTQAQADAINRRATKYNIL